MSLSDALKLVPPGSGYDLIEIAPGAVPPVGRVMSYDKFRYEQDKLEKKERLAQKTGGVKRVQISARAALNDLQVKLRKLEEFLAEGNQVEVFLRLRGREKGNKGWADMKLQEFLKMITTEFKVISPAKFGGQGVFVQIIKK
jgi:translation initiation factor IF-3